MSDANGLRLLLAARKSRKVKGDDEAVLYERQDHRAREWGSREGHAIIHATADVKSSQSAPWTRKELGPWMREPEKLALYDALLISDTDRISRGTDEDFHYIEDWCYRNRKRIIVADGPQFPPREGPMGDSDRYQWIAQKRAARTYWEAVRDKHADTREVIKANGGAIGKAPFGYRIEGEKYNKRFVVDDVSGPIAREVFQRLADGQTATSIAIWFSEQTSRHARAQHVREIIRNRSYLGERDGHTFPSLLADDPAEAQKLWDDANAAFEARSRKWKDKGGRPTVHGYSGLIYCECGSIYYRHKAAHSRAKYRCSRGRSGDLTGQRCEFPAADCEVADAAIDAEMTSDITNEYVMVTTGGDAGKRMELARINKALNSAQARKDWAEVARLAAEAAEIEARPSQPIRTEFRRTGRKNYEAWQAGTIADRRAILAGLKGRRMMTVYTRNGEVLARMDDAEDFPPYTPQALQGA